MVDNSQSRVGSQWFSGSRSRSIFTFTANLVNIKSPADNNVAGALSLYLDAFNIFISLLSLLNSNRD